MFNFSALPPLSLYVHLPWCVRKCPYCDFNSHEARAPIAEREYVDALIADLEQELPKVWGRSVVSVFIGGGTPSLFSPAAMDRLLSMLRALLALQPDIEITLEANPGTIDEQRLAEYRAAGINRLSIGVQSFNDALLQAIGRIHGRRQAIAAAEAAHGAGFDNFNLDLMFGLPGQTPKQALADIEDAAALAPAHVSYYELTIEPNTWFHRHPPTLPEDQALADIQVRGQARLAAAGYARYEISAYARENRRCAHNLNYWQFGDYLGIGAGAHAKISDAQHQTITRLSKLRGPGAYMAEAATAARISEERRLSAHDAALEFMMNALRLTDGFPTHLFQEHTGLPISAVTAPLQQAEQKGLIEWDVSRIRPTEQGSRYLNDLLTLFMKP